VDPLSQKAASAPDKAAGRDCASSVSMVSSAPNKATKLVLYYIYYQLDTVYSFRRPQARRFVHRLQLHAMCCCVLASTSLLY
jgi:hypothetical protein